jgi:hypothetical protein
MRFGRSLASHGQIGHEHHIFRSLPKSNFVGRGNDGGMQHAEKNIREGDQQRASFRWQGYVNDGLLQLQQHSLSEHCSSVFRRNHGRQHGEKARLLPRKLDQFVQDAEQQCPYSGFFLSRGSRRFCAEPTRNHRIGKVSL